MSPLIHIGFHKTGTSLLRARLFTRTDLGFERLRDDRRLIPAAFVLRGSFQGAEPVLLDQLRQEAAQASALGRTLVLSHERLSGYPASGGFDARLIADRLWEAFPDGRILIGIREQVSLIASAWSQYIVDGGALPLARFLRPLEAESVLRQPQFNPAFYAFHRCVRHYQERFGSGRVLVLPFEWLSTAPETAVAAILRLIASPAVLPAEAAAAILSVRVNPAAPALCRELRRLDNRILGRNQLAPCGLLAAPRLHGLALRLCRWLPGLPHLDRFVSERNTRLIRSRVGMFFADSNSRLMALTGLDLGGLGYLCRPTR